MGDFKRVSKTLNSDITIGNFTLDEVSPIVFSLGYSLATKQDWLVVIVLFCISVYISIYYKKIKETQIRGFGKHFFYWLGINHNSKSIPASSITHFYGG
jgi:hypothetical protein